MSTLESFRDAIGGLTRVYRDHVQSCADDLIEAVQGGEFTDRDEFVERISQDCDGDEWVIYTDKAQVVALISDHSGYAAENFGGESLVKDGQINWALIAYCALEQDIIEALERSGFDVNDDDLFDEDEEEA
jgi:hypothetical protein